MSHRLISLIFGVYMVATSAFGQQLVSELTLARVADLYVQNNLELEAARSRLERSRAEQIAARLRPNPSLTFTAENFAVSGPTPFERLYEVGAIYSETLELGGKRSRREKFSAATLSAAEAQFEDTMRKGIAETKRLYFETILARASVEVARENRQTFEQLVQLNQTRLQEGAIPEIDLIKVRLERVKVESGLRQAELTARQGTIRLLERLGISDNSRSFSGELTFVPVTVDLNTLRQTASSERSDVLAAMAEINAAKERLALERARSKPDITPFAGYKRLGEDNTLQFGVSIPLKLRDQNQAEIARAESDVKTAEVRLKLVRSHAIAEVEAAYASVEAATGLVEIFQTDLLRQADEAQTIALAAYQEGGTELLPVLEAQRTRAEVRQQYFKTLFDYQTSIVALELAAGTEIFR
jgi:cobalt-zinc-cadmium efflux system outer membrane protein